MSGLLGDVTAVLVTKRPEIGSVKTRLSHPNAAGAFSSDDALAVAAAMLRCTARRLAASGRLVLAVSPDGCGPELARSLDLPDLETVDQGPGDLGARLDRIWLAVGPDRPVAFFGADAPDVPEEMLGRIPAALDEADAALGPAGDGGYWTLAAGARQPALLRRIDWGTPLVYDQTLQRAVNAGLRVQVLPRWHDVDRPEDVVALRQRLRQHLSEPAATSALLDARPLRRLADRLDAVCGMSPPSEPPS